MTSQIINVAIVLMGIYIALAVAASWIQEQFAAIVKLRGNTLEKGIKELVSRDAATFADLAKHPLITAASSEAKAQFPSYVDARNFTLAFWQSVGKTANAVSTGPLGKAISDPHTALQNLVEDVNAWTPADGPAENVKKSAVALLTSAEGDYDKLLKATDTWFNSQMDRVSGWYKRNAQYILIVIAFAIAFVLGVDTIDIGRQLFASPAIAQATSQTISAAVQQAEKNDPKGTDPDTSTKAVAKAILDSQDLQNLRLFWWSSAPKVSGNVVTAVPGTSGLEKFFGVLITAIAVSLGAPFWFDLLKYIVNVRMSGEKPAATPPAATPNPSK